MSGRQLNKMDLLCVQQSYSYIFLKISDIMKAYTLNQPLWTFLFQLEKPAVRTTRRAR